jgi:predicted nucleic acid-binding protein
VQVVLDADVLIAGTLASRGACSELLDRWAAGEFEIVTCPLLLGEVSRALLHPRISGRYAITTTDVAELVSRLREDAVHLPDPVGAQRVVPSDPNEDYLVALALTPGTGVLTTRDHDFDAVRVPGVRILSPQRLLRELQAT